MVHAALDFCYTGAAQADAETPHGGEGNGVTLSQTEHPGARLCPNCGQRPGDTNTAYDEVVASSVSSSGGFRSHRLSVRAVSTYGRVWLCAPCAAAYRRVVALRARSQQLLRVGGIGLVIGILLFALLYAALQRDVALVALLSLPLLAGTLVLLTGIGMLAASRLLKGKATRFLTSPNLARMAAPEERPVASGTPHAAARLPEETLTRAERRARRANARRRQRLKLTAIGAGSIAGLVVVVTILSLAIQHLRLSTDAYSADLTASASGWANDEQCAEHDGAYHVAPPGQQYGVMCLAPTGDYQNFDLKVTAHLVSGPAQSSFGIVFRAGDTLTIGNGYVFVVSEDGGAQLDVLQNGTVTPLSAAWQFPAGVSRVPGASHVVEVQASGGTLTCLVDGSQVGSLSDGRFDAGRVGLYVAQPGADIAFTQFSVTPA
jgi:hypothetical protein